MEMCSHSDLMKTELIATPIAQKLKRQVSAVSATSQLSERDFNPIEFKWDDEQKNEEVASQDDRTTGSLSLVDGRIASDSIDQEREIKRSKPSTDEEVVLLARHVNESIRNMGFSSCRPFRLSPNERDSDTSIRWLGDAWNSMLQAHIALQRDNAELSTKVDRISDSVNICEKQIADALSKKAIESSQPSQVSKKKRKRS